LGTLRIARDLSEGNVFSHEQAERLGNALTPYWAEVRSELVTKEHFDARLIHRRAFPPPLGEHRLDRGSLDRCGIG
jgi:hypothetical protein